MLWGRSEKLLDLIVKAKPRQQSNGDEVAQGFGQEHRNLQLLVNISKTPPTFFNWRSILAAKRP
jgi:hypothetical protein